MTKGNLQKAIESLEIQDIYLANLSTSSSVEINPRYIEALKESNIQTVHQVIESAVLSSGDTPKLLQVSILLGVRWIDGGTETADKKVHAQIESTFIAEYAMKSEIDQESIDEFALRNASFHVWPYWRELLSNLCLRMNLPKTTLPMMQLAQNRNELE